WWDFDGGVTRCTGRVLRGTPPSANKRVVGIRYYYRHHFYPLPYAPQSFHQKPPFADLRIIYIHARERFSSPPSPQSVTIRILYPHRSSPPTPLSRYPPPLFPFTTYTKSAADPTKSSSRRFGVLVSSLHHHPTVLTIDATVFLLFRLYPSSPLASDKSPVDCNTAQPGFSLRVAITPPPLLPLPLYGPHTHHCSVAAIYTNP
ncbi:Uncharacterized protein FWK35_00028724, partial [Aphis craccivora]